MYNGSKAKFEQNPDLKEELLATKGNITFNGSTEFWCKWNSRITELIREELRPQNIQNKEKIKLIKDQMKDYEAEQIHLQNQYL